MTEAEQEFGAASTRAVAGASATGSASCG
jgi:hypothetical protein